MRVGAALDGVMPHQWVLVKVAVEYAPLIRSYRYRCCAED